MAVCVASCVLFEYLWEKAVKKPSTVNDLSAAVTGAASSLQPAADPFLFWMAVLGSLFSMIVVKHLFGGLGCNIVNPALAGRAMMLTSWPVPMTTWTIDGVSGPTPLALIKSGALDQLPEPSGPLHRPRRRLHRRDLRYSPSDRLRHPSLEGHNQMAHPRRLRRDGRGAQHGLRAGPCRRSMRCSRADCCSALSLWRQTTSRHR